jgi:hypothetical protein
MKNEQERPRQNISHTLVDEQQVFREDQADIMKDVPQEGYDARGNLVRIEAVNLTGLRPQQIEGLIFDALTSGFDVPLIYTFPETTVTKMYIKSYITDAPSNTLGISEEPTPQQ